MSFPPAGGFDFSQMSNFGSGGNDQPQQGQLPSSQQGPSQLPPSQQTQLPPSQQPVSFLPQHSLYQTKQPPSQHSFPTNPAVPYPTVPNIPNPVSSYPNFPNSLPSTANPYANIPNIQLPNIDPNQVAASNPLVPNMFRSLAEAISVIKSLSEDVHRLQAEVNAYKADRIGSPGSLALSARFSSCSRSISLTPSDSPSRMSSSPLASQLEYNHHQPAVRPADMPVKVLWHFEDCKDDPDVNLTASNPSRPSMRKCIQHKNGALVTDGEYSSIRSAVRSFKPALLELPLSVKGKGRPAKATKAYLTRHFPKEWVETVELLEAKQPLLALCADHWKAKHLLANMLVSEPQSSYKARPPGTTSDDPEEDSDDGKAASSAPSANKKRPSLSIASNQLRKKTKQDSAVCTEQGAAGAEHRDNNWDNNTTTTDKPNQQLTRSLLLTPSFLATAAISPPSSGIDVSFISVNLSFDTLERILSEEFPSITAAPNLLQAMKSSPTFKDGTPSSRMIAFTQRINSADPNAPDLDEDNTNASWGHAQFTAANMTCMTVLSSWEDVGNTNAACKLIAAAIKTCKVARHICFVRKVESSSFLADIYLASVIDLLWSCWKTAGGPVAKGKGKAEPKPMTANTSVPAPASRKSPRKSIGSNEGRTLHATTTSSNNETTAASKDGTTDTDNNLHERMQVLFKDELKDWIVQHDLSLPGPRQSKEEFISAVVASPASAHPTRADIDNIVQSRKKSRKSKV